MRREVVGVLVAIGVLGVPAAGAAQAHAAPGGTAAAVSAQDTARVLGPEDDGWG